METPNLVHPDSTKLIGANNHLGFRLLSWLVEQNADKNVFISPFSLGMALAMAYNGADGKTKRALAELLGLTGSNLEQVNEANAELLALQDGIDPEVQFAIANSIWVRSGISPSTDFMQCIKEYYAGQAAGLDFSRADAADIINNWVADKTFQKIRELVAPPVIKLAVLILINAIYFKGLWAQPFDKERTAEKDFFRFDGSPTKCLMMSQSGSYGYFETDEFQAVNLPYGQGRISMYIFLPKPNYTIGDFQKALSYENWQRWFGSMTKTPGEIALPRFRVEYGEDLLKGIVALGGYEIAGVDFARIGAGPLQISNVIHRTFVEVNEEGTEAAAATVVVLTRALPSKPFVMTIDRPFFAAICDNATGAVFFMGFILDPMRA